MSLKGRVSKTKKLVYDAQEKIGALDREKHKFTHQGQLLITRLKNEFSTDLHLLDELKGEILTDEK